MKSMAFLQNTRLYLKVVRQEVQPFVCRSFRNGLSVSVQQRYVSSESSEKILEDVKTNSEALPRRKKKVVECPENARLMKVSIIGVPNAGKSTIINALTNYDVCPVSKRPHTTRKNQKAVYLDENTQLVFVDTPGLVSVREIKKFSFTEEFVYGPEKSIGSAHLIAVIHDVSNTVTRDKLDFRIKAVLKKFPDKKSILILNKIDTIKVKKTLLDTVKYLTSGVVGGKMLPIVTYEEKKQSHKKLDTEQILLKAKQRVRQQEIHSVDATDGNNIGSRCFTDDEIRKGIHQLGWPNFHDIFMVSALEGDGIDLLRRYMVMNAVPESWLYDADTLTDVPPDKLALKILQAKLLEHLPQEVPFRVQPAIEYWDTTDSGELRIIIKIKCPKERYRKIIIGADGSLINRITKDGEKVLSSLLNCPVDLSLNPVFDGSIAKK